MVALKFGRQCSPIPMGRTLGTIQTVVFIWIGCGLLATCCAQSGNENAAATVQVADIDLPWDLWQRSAVGLQRWPEYDVDGIQVWRQSSKTALGQSVGAVYFLIPPVASDSAAVDPTAETMLERMELPRLDNVVERVWWWPLGSETAGDTEPKTTLKASEYSLPFVPPVKRLMKFAQTPTRWTLSFVDPPAVARQLQAGGVVVMDVRGEPQLNSVAQVIQPSADGAIILPAAKAKVFGTQLQFEPLPQKNTVGYWVNADDHAMWKMKPANSGLYRVELLQGCGGGQGGSQIEIRFGDTAIKSTVEETGHFQNFRWRDLGEIQLVGSETVDVSIRCVAKAKAAVMDVRELRLVPVGSDSAGSKLAHDVHQTTPDVDLPPLTLESPAAGRRSIRQAAITAGSGAYHLLTLPTDWNQSRKYPVLVEWTGNGPYENERGDRSTGRVEDARMGHGLSGGDGWIVLSLPFLNDSAMANVTRWWGDSPKYRIEPTLQYAEAAINEVCEQFGGDRSKLVLVGFSRGSIACNAVGLGNDSVAPWWRAFICFSHYDGVSSWPPTDNQQESIERLQRLGGRPQYIISESPTAGQSASLADNVRKYLAQAGQDVNDPAKFSFAETGFVNHSDAWAMRPCEARDEVRKWLLSVTKP